MRFAFDEQQEALRAAARAFLRDHSSSAHVRQAMATQAGYDPEKSARSAAYYAGWAAADGDPELPTLASRAKAYCSDTYFQCAAENLQIHGGIGFTWEHDAHLHLKRAKSSETLLGDAVYHRGQVARRIGL